MRAPGRLLVLLTAMAGALAMTARAGGPVASLLDPYFRIQDALVDDRIDTVKADAALVQQHATTLGDDGKEIAAAAVELGRAGDVAAARLAFGKLSDAVIAYSEHTRTSPGNDVVTMYCPMAKKSWMQKGEKVRNPYYGKAMPDCGEKKKVG